MGIAQQIPVDAPRQLAADRDLLPQGRHWRRARDVLTASAADGVYGVATVLDDIPVDDRPMVVYCLTQLAKGEGDPMPATGRVGRPRLPGRYEFSEEEAREAHRLHSRGDRTPWAVEGQRAYSRFRKQAQRRAQL